MAKLAYRSLVLCAVVVLCGQARGQDPQAIIDKAIAAHGGMEKLSKYRAAQSKSKGTIDTAFGSFAFTSESFGQQPDKFKSVMELDANGMKFTVTQIINGDKITINNNGQALELNDEMKNEAKEQLYAERLVNLIHLKDKDYEFAPLAEIQIDGKPAIGLKVTSKGHKEVSMYFDKQSGLLAKTQNKTMDMMTMQEVTQEKIFGGYKDYEGIKRPTKVLVNRDGKKFMELEVIEAKYMEKLDDSVFQS
jgi:hypothetical protein